ncbi:uncharacterized protein [Notamacropus eugenii]|uniref:uncharacterized protein isoform X2 n=1 Tax=Notamacropus eugenii TaxID=9315 RepID=UPI003B67B355
MAAKEGITKGLSSEERNRSLQFFLFLLSSAVSQHPSWKGLQDLYGRSLCDDSSPSELSASLGYVPPFQSCKESSDIPIQQIPINNGETSRTTGCGTYIQNKETSGQGIIIKSPLPTLHNGSTVSERELDMPLKDIKPSELATTEENFLEKLEHMLELEIQEMGLNIQQETCSNMIWPHPKSSKEQLWRNKIELEKPHEIEIKEGKVQRKDPVSLFHRSEPPEENPLRDEGFHVTTKKDSLEREQIKEVKEQREDPISLFHPSEPWEENLSRDEGFHETAEKDSLEREQIKEVKAQRKDPVSLFHHSEPREENLSRDEGFHETARKDSLEREQIKEVKAQRKDPVSLFHHSEPREENLSRDEGFHETARKDSLEREQEITKVLSSEESHRSLEVFSLLFNSASSKCPTCKGSEDLHGRSFCDDSSPSELSASLGYVPPFQSCEDSSDIPVQQISLNNEETSRTTDSGRYIQNKETSGQGIIIKSPLPTPHNVSPVSERHLDVPFKGVRPSELATVEEDFQENLEDILEPGIQEMGLNIQQGTWRNRKCHHEKSSKEQFCRNIIEFEKPCEIRLMILPNFRELTTEPSCNYPSESQSTSFGNPSSRSSSVHCLLL